MLPRKHEFSRMLLKPETENGKRGTGNGERGTGKEDGRVVSNYQKVTVCDDRMRNSLTNLSTQRKRNFESNIYNK